MTATLSAFALRLADFYLVATVFLLATATVMVALRQPARRLGAASAGLAGLVLLAALAVLPFWPRVPVGRLYAAVHSSAETGTAVAGPAEPLADPAADEAEEWLLDEGARERKAAELPAIPAMPPEDATGPGFGIELSDRVLAGLAGLFLAGAGGLAIWLLRGAVQAARLTARSWAAPPWLQAELNRLMGTERCLARLRLSQDITSAVALGVWRPTILLPAALAEEAGQTQLRAVLAHEWAHIRHGDLGRLAVSRWLFVLLFAHPVYWWLRRALRQDQELLADAVAVAGSGLSTADYAEVLVGWARRSASRAALAAAALGIWERPSQLTRRIAMLLDERFHVEAGTTRRWRYGVLIAAGLAAVGLSVLTLTAERPVRAAEQAAPQAAPAGAEQPDDAAGRLNPSERAIAAALNWLARHQAEEGRWSFEHAAACKDSTCTGLGNAKSDSAATAAALLAFLAAGQTHQTKGPYQKAIERGSQWLVQRQAADGNLAGSGAAGPKMYAHGMAALALCEAYGMSGDKQLAGPAQKAVDYIEWAQNPQTGGWRYLPGQEGDTSVLGWQVLALKSAKLAGLAVKPATFDGAQKYLKTVAQGERGGKFSYVPGSGPSLTMTAVGLLSSQCLGAKPADPAVAEGVQFLMTVLPDAEKRRDSYHWFFTTQVLHRKSGPDWDAWNRPLRGTLIETQVKDGCAAGSWDPDQPAKEIWGPQGGRLMVTALSALALETYYRYLPIYTSDQSQAKPATGTPKTPRQAKDSHLEK